MDGTYPVETYVQLKDRVILEQRFNNEEYAARVFKHAKTKLERCLHEPDFAQQCLNELNQSLEVCRINMQNIISAIQILEGG